jgi:SAM-dependent methyltransferase
MSSIFGPGYADTYNRLYQDKDYVAECDLMERIFQNYGHGAIRAVLDLGCGTGNHAIVLGARRYEVVGIDRSEEMLAQARSKVTDASTDSRVTFQNGDIRTVDLKRQFDAAVMMFAVLGYQLDDADALAALKAARRHLPLGGLFIFDFWYGPAVLNQRPSERIKTIPTAEGKIVRIASAELDTGRRICTVHYRLRQLAGDRLMSETEEDHSMRYFFPPELRFFLDCSGFTLVRLGAFPEFDRDPDETTWSALGVARAV